MIIHELIEGGEFTPLAWPDGKSTWAGVHGPKYAKPPEHILDGLLKDASRAPSPFRTPKTIIAQKAGVRFRGLSQDAASAPLGLRIVAVNSNGLDEASAWLPLTDGF